MFTHLLTKNDNLSRFDIFARFSHRCSQNGSIPHQHRLRFFLETFYALVKFKKLAGGGYFKIINNSVPAALKNLGYSPKEAKVIINYAKGSATLEGCPHINADSLGEKGFTADKIEAIEAALPSS